MFSKEFIYTLANAKAQDDLSMEQVATVLQVLWRELGRLERSVFIGFHNPRRRHSSLGHLSHVKFECRFAETILSPGVHENAVVLAPVKERPGDVAVRRTASVTAVLDRRSTRQPWERAGRDEKMLAAEPKDDLK
jgi:hypothetical protein